MYFTYKNKITNRLKVKEWKEIYYANQKQNKQTKSPRLATLKSEQRILPGMKRVILRIKSSIHQEEITVLNIYEPNNSASKYKK